MKSLMLSLVLACGGLLPAQQNLSDGVSMPDGTTQYLLENVVYLWILPMTYDGIDIYGLPYTYGEYEVYLLHSNGDTTFFDLSNIDRIESLDGIPTSAYVYYTGPHQLVTTYVDWEGWTRKITTNCAGLTDLACIKKHDKMVAAMKKAHPPATQQGGGD